MIARTRIGITLVGAGAAAAMAVALTTAGAGTGFGVENAAYVSVSALPGADLGDVQRLPGLEATSGPFPSVQTGVRHGRQAADVTLQGRAVRRSAVDEPSLSSGAWTRPGTLVLDTAVAEDIRARVGSRVTVSTARGPAVLRVGGITAHSGATGYLTPDTLARVSPNPQTYDWTLYVRPADPRALSRYARWMRERFPAHQATVEVLHPSG